MVRRKINTGVVRKRELVDGFRRRLPNVFPSREAAETVMEKVFEEVLERLLDGSLVELSGVCWLQIQEGKPTRRVVPGQGEWTGKTKARLVAKLTAGAQRLFSEKAEEKV